MLLEPVSHGGDCSVPRRLGHSQPRNSSPIPSGIFIYSGCLHTSAPVSDSIFRILHCPLSLFMACQPSVASEEDGCQYYCGARVSPQPVRASAQCSAALFLWFPSGQSIVLNQYGSPLHSSALRQARIRGGQPIFSPHPPTWFRKACAVRSAVSAAWREQSAARFLHSLRAMFYS